MPTLAAVLTHFCKPLSEGAWLELAIFAKGVCYYLFWYTFSKSCSEVQRILAVHN